MLTGIMATAVFGFYMYGLNKACDKIVGTDETYEEYLERMANKKAYELREKWRKEEGLV